MKRSSGAAYGRLSRPASGCMGAVAVPGKGWPKGPS